VWSADYEVLEVVGDAYLKWGYGHFVLSRTPLIDREGMLHDLRASLVRL
jgi:dsRNA-specific ribonuclease